MAGQDLGWDLKDVVPDVDDVEDGANVGGVLIPVQDAANDEGIAFPGRGAQIQFPLRGLLESHRLPLALGERNVHEITDLQTSVGPEKVASEEGLTEPGPGAATEDVVKALDGDADVETDLDLTMPEVGPEDALEDGEAGRGHVRELKVDGNGDLHHGELGHGNLGQSLDAGGREQILADHPGKQDEG